MQPEQKQTELQITYPHTKPKSFQLRSRIFSLLSGFDKLINAVDGQVGIIVYENPDLPQRQTYKEDLFDDTDLIECLIEGQSSSEQEEFDQAEYYDYYLEEEEEEEDKKSNSSSTLREPIVPYNGGLRRSQNFYHIPSEHAQLLHDYSTSLTLDSSSYETNLNVDLVYDKNELHLYKSAGNSCVSEGNESSHPFYKINNHLVDEHLHFNANIGQVIKQN